MGRKYDGAIEYKTDENGNEVRVKKNFVPIFTIEAGRSRNKEQTATLENLLNEGFYTDIEQQGHFVFIDNVLSGS